MAIRLESPFLQEFDDDGELLANGFYHFFNTSGQPQDTYPTIGGNATAANPNPLPLGADGRPTVPIFTLDSDYTISLLDSTQTVIAGPILYVPFSAQTEDYIEGDTYNINDVVRYDPDDQLYVSLIDENDTSPASAPNDSWSLYKLLRVWNVEESYLVDQPVIYTDNIIYTCLVANKGTIPLGNPTQWKSSSTPFVQSGSLSQSDLTPGFTTAVTGLGFTPTSLRLYAVGSNGSTYRAAAYGYANSVGDQGSVGDFVISSGVNGIYNSSTRLIRLESDALATDTYNILFVSFDSNGFTIQAELAPSITNVELIWEAEG